MAGPVRPDARSGGSALVDFQPAPCGGMGDGRAVAATLALVLCAWAFYRTTLRHQLWPSVGLLVALMGGALVASRTGFDIAAVVLWCGCAVTAMERLPLAAALPTTCLVLGGFAAFDQDAWLTTSLTTAGLLLGGYVLRLDAEARGSAQRLLAQERAARAAEAESAALAERARIARDIHDVLAHSLSAQLVHLEAARLRIEREPSGPFRDQILERVVAARSMARDGLAETRQALSALRGEMAPSGTISVSWPPWRAPRSRSRGRRGLCPRRPRRRCAEWRRRRSPTYGNTRRARVYGSCSRTARTR